MSERTAGGARRAYRLKKRARQMKETRRRIVEAVVELHRTVGPANTTITDVAKLAGVGRMTVYNHFPSEADLIGACSAHWSARNPPPDAGEWARIADPEERLDAALTEMYEYYGKSEEMMGKVLRDEPLVPALAEVLDEAWWPVIDGMVGTLARGRNLRGARRSRVEAALRLALDFHTWRTLTRSGLDHRQAARLAADVVEAVDRAEARTRAVPVPASG